MYKECESEQTDSATYMQYNLVGVTVKLRVYTGLAAASFLFRLSLSCLCILSYRIDICSCTLSPHCANSDPHTLSVY
jgi:hypothetical protein